MTREEASRAFAVGIELVEEEMAAGLDLIATGEMGIGNTTPSSAHHRRAHRLAGGAGDRARHRHHRQALERKCGD